MLNRVTITGADDSTDILEMLELSIIYPWLEWGILVSRSREGSPRYPSRQWQERLLKSAHRMNISMHACGKWAREIFAGTVDWSELPPIRTVTQRIQINGAVPVDNLHALGACNPGTQFIVQYPRAVSYLRACQASGINCAPLFDESGGEGRQVRAWSDVPDCDYVGYAGGIGSDDVKETVGSIMTFRQGPFWIDSEGRMRDEQDRLDMRKTQRHLEICEGIIDAPQFERLMEAAERKVEARER